MGSIPDLESAKEIAELIRNDDKIILDCRQYIGQGSWPMTDYLTWETKDATAFNNPMGRYPGVFNKVEIQSNQFNSLSSKKKDRIHSAKIVILINELTQSSSEFMVQNLMTISDNVIIVGSPSSGANGTGGHVEIPGGFGISYTTINFCFSNGTQLQRIGIQPDIFIKPTIEDYKNGRDPLVEKALEILNSKP